jgi:16S rRNA (adenine(1408)-N(1))-methyltransferase
MAEASRRAAKPPKKGGLPNALFAVASAERVPEELHGQADELTIQFPWGSLLRGTLGLDGEAARGIARLLKPGGRALATFSVEARDGLELPGLDGCDLARRWSRFGLVVCGFRPATSDDLGAMSSTWARRLAAGRERSAWRLELARTDGLPR